MDDLTSVSSTEIKILELVLLGQMDISKLEMIDPASPLSSVARALGKIERTVREVDEVVIRIDSQDSDLRTIQAHIEHSKQELKGIGESISVIREAVTDLYLLSEDVAHVIGEVEFIADQTSFLALNATIEAARAGEYGKGFQVVANEIKELAKRAGESTVSVVENVNNLQKRANQGLQTLKNLNEDSKKLFERIKSVQGKFKRYQEEVGDCVGLLKSGLRERK